MPSFFDNIYRGKRVLVTGHTGFKGSWLRLWLQELGADVAGFALEPRTVPSHFSLLSETCRGDIGDIADYERIGAAIAAFRPEIVFHLAAQPLVRYSYRNPRETYLTNVIGTLNVCEACRETDSVRAIVAITTDKVYQNNEWHWGYREQDRLGGYDPYSSSKACAEVLLDSYRNSYFNLERYGAEHNVLISSVRAGNVIGGGDWSADRLVPDIMRACSRGDTVAIRHPGATRPWQHVLECLSGYLLVGKRLLEGDGSCASAWNFGPGDDGALSVKEVIEALARSWNAIAWEIQEDPGNPHEARFLKLDCSRAHAELRWKPVWSVERAFARTALWYKTFYTSGAVSSADDIRDYCHDAVDKGAIWARG